MPSIRLENISFSYKNKKKIDTEVLSNFNVSFPSEKTSVIIGSSGCGKTTLLKIILGLEKYQGDVFFNDINVNYLPIKERNISYVNQNITLYSHLSVFENIAFPLKNLRVDGVEIRQRVFEMASLFHVEDLLARYPNQLSIGQCQRVLIAKALIKRPMICIFDEPFSSLDKPLADELTLLLKDIFKAINCTVIFVSHNIYNAFQIADFIYVMEEGKIVESGTPEEIYKSDNKAIKEYLKTL